MLPVVPGYDLNCNTGICCVCQLWLTDAKKSCITQQILSTYCDLTFVTLNICKKYAHRLKNLQEHAP